MITENTERSVRPEWGVEKGGKSSLLSPERSERILVRKECTPHIARCGFEIVAATLRKPSSESLESKADEQNQGRVMSSLLSVLEPGQKITFVYEGGGRKPLNWRILGEASSLESAKQASAGMQNAQHALKTVLESRKSLYRFRALSKTECSGVMTHKWIGSIKPQGTHVKCSRVAVGFKSQNSLQDQADSCVILPHYVHDRAKAFSSIVKLLVSGDEPVQVSIILETFRLSREDVTAIKAAQDVVLDRTRDSELPAHLENAAAAWLKAQVGCRISCSVSSPKPIPESFLKMLSREIYHGAVDVQCRRMVTTPSSSQQSLQSLGILDLSNCFPASATLPPLFPQPEVLVRYGIRRDFNVESPKLPSTGIVIGYVRDGQLEQSVRLSNKERGQHGCVFGATGAGKTTMIRNMIKQDVEEGKGVALIDGGGELTDEVLSFIPAHRADDVVIIDPTDRTRAVGINLLECTGPHQEIQRAFVINEFYSLISSMYDASTRGPMFEQYFRGALGLSMADPSNISTLVDMSAVFEHRPYRESLLKQCGPSLLTDFWRMAERTGGDAQLANIAPYIVSKLNLFVHSALIRPIIGQAKSTIDFREIMDKRRILLVKLPRGALGGVDMRLLGMIVLAKIMCAGMSRLSLAASHRKPFMVYLDECQNFTTDTMPSLLAESRKFGLCLILATQNMSQLSTGIGHDNVLHSILGNCANMVLFRLGAPDSERLSVYTMPAFSAADLANLPNYHACARILTPKGPTLPFVFQTNPAIRQPPDRETQARIRKNYRSYSTSIKKVESDIRNRRAAIRAIGVKLEEKKPSVLKHSDIVAQLLG